MKSKIILNICISCLFALASCKKSFLDPKVTTARDAASSITTVSDLNGLIIGAYDRMNAASYYGRDFIIFGAARSDNAFSTGNTNRFVSTSEFNQIATDGNATGTWQQIYAVIANANLVVNATVENDDSKEVKFAKGQAYFIRALCYMDLVRLYGQQNAGGNLGVPLVIQFKSEELFPTRATVDETWAQIGADLDMAAQMMDPSLDPSSPTEVTTWAVYALQSRYYLYVKDWAKAAAAADKVISSGKFSTIDAANYVSSWGSGPNANSIFEMAFTATDNLGFNSLYFIIQETSYGDIQVTQDLYDQYEATDVRKDLYTKTGSKIRMTGKYPSPDYTDNIKVIRYDEVILNYAEALTQSGSPNALQWLNWIPNHRNATPYATATLNNVYEERRKELAMEGHRFFDLMRWSKDVPKVDPGQTFSATIPFGDSRLAFPIPQVEINANPQIEQNKGY